MVKLDQGIRSRGLGMIGCQERRYFEKVLPRLDLETWILFSSSILKCVVQPVYQSGFSSKIEATAANMFDQMWTSTRSGVRMRLYRVSLEYET